MSIHAHLRSIHVPLESKRNILVSASIEINLLSIDFPFKSQRNQRRSMDFTSDRQLHTKKRG